MERDCPENADGAGAAITSGCVNTRRIVDLAISTPSSAVPKVRLLAGVGEPV
jgi:hypothetical protein